jgi:cytochrome c oxidase subunit 3/cytochrome o ubiquinol oxidase subunit 3
MDMQTDISHQDEFRAGRALGLDHVKLGMWLFIASEVMFFGGLLAAYLHFKFRPPVDPGAELLDVVLVGINTFVLLSSSFTVALGLASAKEGKKSRLTAFMGLTITLGLIFLGGQIYEFVTLWNEGVTLSSSVFGSSFFVLTGFHGLHVLIGVIWASAVLLRAMRGKYSPKNYQGVEIFGLYWHFVDIVWIVLFTLIYLV